MTGLRTIGVSLALCLMISSPSFAKKHKRAPKEAAQATLFKQLGGMKAINAVVNDFVGRAASDERIKSFFAKTAANPKQLNRFKKNLAEQICQAAGGPCKYKGKDMKTAHAGMGITEDHFNALVEDLSATLDKFKVKPNAKGQLLGALAPMKRDIVSAESNRGISSDASAPPPSPAPEK